MRTQLVVLLGTAALAMPAAAQAQNPLRSIFNCENPNNRQQGGAIVGGLLGGLLGSQVDDDNRATGAILGGLLGAAAGSAIGCNMSSNEINRAEEATRRALEENRSTTWADASSGVSGRIDIVNSYQTSDASGRTYDPNYDRYGNRNDDRYGDRYGDRYRPTSLADVRFATGVLRPADYVMSDLVYEARTRTNVRAGPSARDRVLTQLYNGERFDAVATVRGGWLLAVRDGQAIGYVSEDVVRRVGERRDYAYDNRRPAYQSVAQTCRVFDQTVQRRGQPATTQRFTACRNDNGEWILQA